MIYRSLRSLEGASPFNPFFRALVLAFALA